MHEELRSIPLIQVIRALGIDTKFKRRANGEYYGACIFHEPKRNQTSFSFTDSVFNCFSCGVKGKGSIDLTMRYRNCGFAQAVEYLKTLGHIQAASVEEAAGEGVSEESQSVVLENKPFKASYEKFYVDCPWLKERVGSVQVLKRYGVGMYSNPSRKSLYTGKVMFPIRSLNGEKVGYLSRTITPNEGEPKYLFPKGFHKAIELYGAYEASVGQVLPHRLVYLVESPLCVLKLASYGLVAVSPFGWSVSDAQVAILRQLTRGVVYLPDSDKREDAKRIVPLLSNYLWVRFPDFPADDPEFLSEAELRTLMR